MLGRARLCRRERRGGVRRSRAPPGTPSEPRRPWRPRGSRRQGLVTTRPKARAGSRAARRRRGPTELRNVAPRPSQWTPGMPAARFSSRSAWSSLPGTVGPAMATWSAGWAACMAGTASSRTSRPFQVSIRPTEPTNGAMSGTPALARNAPARPGENSVGSAWSRRSPGCGVQLAATGARWRSPAAKRCASHRSRRSAAVDWTTISLACQTWGSPRRAATAQPYQECSELLWITSGRIRRQRRTMRTTHRPAGHVADPA